MALVLNYRGSSGSGKSTLVRSLLGRGRTVKLHKEFKFTLCEDRPDTCAVGSYFPGSGADGVPSQDHVCDQIRYLVKEFDVVYVEGLIVSGLYKRYAALDDELARDGHTFVWVFLNVPDDIAIARVYERNGGKPFSHDNLLKKAFNVRAARREAIKANRFVIDLPLMEKPRADQLIRA